ncbi:MAG: histidine kinase [Rhodospirillales bacterium]|nr:histidine kinase [Rhodospirillales bacterium]
MKTKFLVTPEHPDGWRIEDLLAEVQNDIIRRTQRIIDDTRPDARAVLNNNIEIMTLLSKCIEKALDSTRILNSLGPHQKGQPRIGVL